MVYRLVFLWYDTYINNGWQGFLAFSYVLRSLINSPLPAVLAHRSKHRNIIMQNTKYEVRPIAGFEGLYSVSNAGEVFSHRFSGSNKTKQLKPSKDNQGYFRVLLYQDGKGKSHFIHRLVLEAFVPNPDNKPYCDHIDTNPRNNHVSNLRWCTHKENMNNPLTLKNISAASKGKTHSEETRSKISEVTKGENNPRYDTVIYTFQNKKSGEVFVGTQYDFYTTYNLNQGNVCAVVNGRYKSTKGWVLVQVMS